jgi:hypothetical protein
MVIHLVSSTHVPVSHSPETLAQFISGKKPAKCQWLQNLSQMNEDNPNNVRLKPV